MIGRSSRTRGVCEGALHIATEEKGSQVLERLKRHGVVVLQELERFVTLAEKRSRDPVLVKHL